MKFYAAPKKPVNIPILSLLDILAILLIYTVVSSKFVDDDYTSNAKGNGAGDRKQAALKVETPSTDTLSVKNVSEKRTQIVLAADGRISYEGSIIAKSTLVDYLKVLKDTGGKLEIKADKKVTLDQWVFVLESLKKANISASDVPWLIKETAK